MTDPKIQHLLDELDSILPPAFLHDPPLIRIDGDGMTVDYCSDHEGPKRFYVRALEDNLDVWEGLETEGL